MMKSLIAAAALAALVTTATAASATAPNPKPGEYARNSKVYAEYIANCKTERNTRPDMRDEAARRLEKLSRAQIELQISNCQGEERLAAERLAKQQHTTNIPPAAYIGAGAAVGAAVVRAASRNNNRNSRGGREYRSFDNVAEDSYRVTTKKGKEFDLRNVNAGSLQCLPPKQKHRSERCTSIPGGGIRCKFDCY